MVSLFFTHHPGLSPGPGNWRQTMRDSLIAVFLLVGLSPLSQAKDLGTWGDTWPVAEQSFLAFIQTRLATMMHDGTLSALQHQFVQRVEAHALRPVPVPSESRHPGTYLLV